MEVEVRRRTLLVTGREAAVVHRVVKVCHDRLHGLESYADLVQQDVPLPPVGTGSNGSSGAPSKHQTWSTTWSGVNGPNAATQGTVGKPALGRDPKSRARSRDYLKQ